MKRIISLLLCLALTVVMLSACSQSNNSTNAPAAEKSESADNAKEDAAAPAAKEPVRIIYKSLAWLKAEQDMTQAVINEWNETHPEIQVEYAQGDWGTVDQEMLTGFETGDVPDIFHYWTAPITLWKQFGYLADLTPMINDEMQNDVNGEIWNLFRTADGKITALPFQSEVDMIFYNKDMFEAKGITPPTADKLWTLDELIEAGKKLNDPDNGVYGLAIQGLNWGARFFNDSWATKINYSPLIEKDGNFELQLGGKYRELAEKLIKIADDGLMDQGNIAGGYDGKAAFLDGKVAILAGYGCWMRSQFINENEGKDINWGMLPPVTIDSPSTYGAIQTLSIPEKSKNKEAAMEFLKWYWNVDNQTKIAESAYIFPGRNSAMAKLDKPTDGWDLTFISARALVVPNYVTVPGWGSFMEGTGKTIYSEWFNKQITFEEFEQKMNNQLIPFLEEAKNQ